MPWVIALAPLTLVAAGMPPSARPTVPLEPTETKAPATDSAVPRSGSAPQSRDRSDDPALVVSVDLGNLWHKLAPPNERRTTGRAEDRFAVPDVGGDTAGAVAPSASARCGDSSWAPSPPTEVAAPSPLRAFLTAVRAQGPPAR